MPLFELVDETPIDLASGDLLMDATAFVALNIIAPPPLWGTEEHALLVEGGLAIFAGRPGVGKTTAIIDLVCHLAAGIPWPPRDEETKHAPEPYPVPRRR